jgi:lipopolysaccharide/colanic/teichoic acid biosynthesis glycosyltransferase
VPRGALRSAGNASAYRTWGKRAFDIALVLATAPMWLPVILLAALAIYAVDRKSPFYTQERLGLDRKVFRLWKLRTMVVDADARLEAYLERNPEARAEWDATQKLKRDPRITPVGQLLRKTSLDELPQIVNVLAGDMSLVGPRPIMASQENLYPGERYYEMRPGLTGLWQVSDRNECTFVERVRFDDIYNRTLSLGTDLAILRRTVGVVVRGTGY